MSNKVDPSYPCPCELCNGKKVNLQVQIKN